MDDEKLFKGFNQDFLVDEKIKQKVRLPSLQKKKKTELSPVKYNDKLKIDYDYEQFKKTFDAEMEKMAKERSN